MEQGAFLCYTEMVSAEGLARGGRKSWALLARAENESLWGVQLFGSEPRALAAAVRLVAPLAPSLLDLNCGCSVAGIGHVVLSNSDVYVFNGTGIQSIIDKRLRKWLFANISPTNKKNSFVVNHASDSEVWICIPTTGTACDTALVWSYGDGGQRTWAIRTLPNATAALHAPLSEVVAAPPVIEASWRIGASGQCVLDAPGDPALKPYRGRALLSVVAADGSPLRIIKCI